ncbi:hypothetical protein XH93_21675 [Bradyrhizobium sp. CCBAU 51753]|nr:hypothetical protein XH93_21675 [Bradyrhizobium sp. CCBAU 51753]
MSTAEPLGCNDGTFALPSKSGKQACLLLARGRHAAPSASTSASAGQSVVPIAFWFFSMGGGLMTLIYGLAKREPVVIIGQGLATLIYIHNIMLIIKSRGSASKTLDR